MSDVPRPPMPETLRERLRRRWSVVQFQTRWQAESVLGGRSLAANIGVFVVIAACCTGLSIGAFWGWSRWSDRSVPAVENLIPRIAPEVASIERMEIDDNNPPGGTARTVQTPSPAQPVGGEGGVTTEAVITDAETPRDQPEIQPDILVHVAGEVARPGVVTLPVGARIGDAVLAAGGATVAADPDRLNLAAVVRDGQRVFVAAIGETVPAVVPADPASQPVWPAGTAVPDEPPGPIDVNTASARELENLPGVGPATAAAIVDHRTRRGPFFEPEGLLDVPGIGPAKFARLAPLVVASAP